MTHTNPLPDAFGHNNVLANLLIDVGNKRKVGLEAFNGEEAVDKGVEEKLVKIIVYASSIDALRQQCLHGTPRHLLRGEISAPLHGWRDGNEITPGAVHACTLFHGDVYFIECP